VGIFQEIVGVQDVSEIAMGSASAGKEHIIKRTSAMKIREMKTLLVERL
jgi:hypothetical protein